jgi:hypothetical protein
LIAITVPLNFIFGYPIDHAAYLGNLSLELVLLCLFRCLLKLSTELVSLRFKRPSPIDQLLPLLVQQIRQCLGFLFNFAELIVFDGLVKRGVMLN